jgi:hypothetical protein
MPKVRPTGYEVRESAKPHRGKTWRVIGYKDGVRHQYWFTSEKEARADARDRNAELSNYGAKVSLNPADRLEAFRASELLKPFGKTIMDATRFYLEHLNRTAVSVPFSALAAKVREEFVRREKANEVSNRHARTLRETLSKLELKFSDRIVSEITKDETREWLLSLPLKLKTKNKHRGYASQIFGLAKEFGYAAANPFSEIKKFRERVTKEDEKGTSSAEQTEKLFRAAEPEVIPFLTLSFFCGIRTATIRRWIGRT